MSCVCVCGRVIYDIENSSKMSPRYVYIRRRSLAKTEYLSPGQLQLKIEKFFFSHTKLRQIQFEQGPTSFDDT